MNKKRSLPDKLMTLSGKQLLYGSLAILAIALTLVVGLRPTQTGLDNAPSDQVGAVQGDVTIAGCQVVQHLSYVPCGHSITRRMELPQELIGKTRDDVAAAYDQYRIASFAQNEIVLEQELNMYCADHVVLLPDETGYLCVFQNKYGDAMALVESLELALKDLPDAVQEDLKRGMGFDDFSALEQWLESVES